MKKPYVIQSPEFDVTSGGIRVMWGLYGALLAKGQIAFINRKPDMPVIGIYPEIYHGNPMGAETVVRYILNKPGVMGNRSLAGFSPGPTTFAPNDKIYVFSKIFDVFGVPQSHLLFLPILDLHTFKDMKKRRDKTCYLVGKGKNLLHHPAGSVELTRQFAFDQEKLAELLNECSTLYTYDDMSAMTEIARLCGCRVRYFGKYTPEEWKNYEPGINGVGFYGKDVPLDVDAFREHYIGMKRLFSERLDEFIEETQ